MKNNTEQFLMVHYRLLGASGYISKDGERVKMNLTEKIIYSHLRNRFQFFKSIGKEYYDTQQAIAAVCNMDLKATGNVLRKFIKNGLTTIYKKPYGNFVKNVYVDVPPLRLWDKEGILEVEAGIDYYEYETPDDFIPNLPDVGYSREHETQEDDIDLENRR